MGKVTRKGEIVLGYLERFPHTSSLTLARKIYEEHPLEWDGVESIRLSIRYFRGSMGDEARKKLADKRFVGTGDPLPLPKTLCEPYEKFVIPVGNSRIMALCDIHIPFHDIEALKIALNTGKDRNVNTMLLLAGRLTVCVVCIRITAL